MKLFSCALCTKDQSTSTIQHTLCCGRVICDQCLQKNDEQQLQQVLRECKVCFAAIRRKKLIKTPFLGYLADQLMCNESNLIQFSNNPSTIDLSSNQSCEANMVCSRCEEKNWNSLFFCQSCANGRFSEGVVQNIMMEQVNRMMLCKNCSDYIHSVGSFKSHSITEISASYISYMNQKKVQSLKLQFKQVFLEYTKKNIKNDSFSKSKESSFSIDRSYTLTNRFATEESLAEDSSNFDEDEDFKFVQFCQFHPSKILKKTCTRDYSLLCDLCIDNHRANCIGNIASVDMASRGFVEQLIEVQKTLERLSLGFQNEKNGIEKILEQSSRQVNETKQRIREQFEDLIMNIKQRENQIIEQIDRQYENSKSDISSSLNHFSMYNSEIQQYSNFIYTAINTPIHLQMYLFQSISYFKNFHSALVQQYNLIDRNKSTFSLVQFTKALDQITLPFEPVLFQQLRNLVSSLNLNGIVPTFKIEDDSQEFQERKLPLTNFFSSNPFHHSQQEIQQGQPNQNQKNIAFQSNMCLPGGIKLIQSLSSIPETTTQNKSSEPSLSKNSLDPLNIQIESISKNFNSSHQSDSPIINQKNSSNTFKNASTSHGANYEANGNALSTSLQLNTNSSMNSIQNQMFKIFSKGNIESNSCNTNISNNNNINNSNTNNSNSSNNNGNNNQHNPLISSQIPQFGGHLSQSAVEVDNKQKLPLKKTASQLLANNISYSSQQVNSFCESGQIELTSATATSNKSQKIQLPEQSSNPLQTKQSDRSCRDKSIKPNIPSPIPARESSRQRVVKTQLQMTPVKRSPSMAKGQSEAGGKNQSANKPNQLSNGKNSQGKSLHDITDLANQDLLQFGELVKNPLSKRYITKSVATCTSIMLQWTHSPTIDVKYAVEYGIGLKVSGQERFTRLHLGQEPFFVIEKLQPKTTYRVRVCAISDRKKMKSQIDQSGEFMIPSQNSKEEDHQLLEQFGEWSDIHSVSTQEIQSIEPCQCSQVSRKEKDIIVLFDKPGLVTSTYSYHYGRVNWTLNALVDSHDCGQDTVACLIVGVTNKQNKKQTIMGSTVNYGLHREKFKVKVQLDFVKNTMIIYTPSQPNGEIFNSLPSGGLFPAFHNKTSQRTSSLKLQIQFE